VILLWIEAECKKSNYHPEFVFRVLQLMNLTDSRLAQGGCEKLELAMLSFFEQFRKIYVGDQVRPSITLSI
jgi:exportin-7